jgi:iron complex outermembrane receptor protein
MEDRGVHSLDDAVRYMPGITSASFGSDTRLDWMRVRGFEPTQFLDGLPLPRGVYANPKPETWNLDRLALLRGPASSIYGQTPPGGLLDMVSRRPEAEASHEIQVQYGSDNHRQINFASTGKIDDEARFLYSVSGVIRDGGTQIDHIDDKRYNIAPSLTWNIDDDTKLTLLTQFTRDDTGVTSQFYPIQGTKIDMPFGKISQHKNLGDPDYDFYDRTYYALGYSFEHRFNDVWQFRQNLRYTKSDLSFQTVTVNSYFPSIGFVVDDQGNTGRGTTNTDEDISQFAVDNNFQGDFATGDVSHTLLIGLDHQRSNTNYTSIFGTAPAINVNHPVYGLPITRPSRDDALYDYDQKTRQTGLYIQDQMALDQWRLTLGGREDWVHTGTKFFNDNDATNTERDKKFSGNAAISYVFDSGFVPYLSYAESFQPTSNATASATKSFKPTEGEQWELGVKYQPPGTNTLLTAAVYDLTQKNVSVTTTVAGNQPVTSQTGEVKVKGLELEAVSDVTDNLKVIAAYTLAKSEVQKGDYKGNRLQLMPNQQASLWADYTWHTGVLDGFGIGAGARYTGNTYGDQGNTWLGKADAYTVFDASVHYDLGRLDGSLKGASLAVNATNLLDKDYISTCDGFYCYYGDQRSVIASATYKW